MKTKTIKQIVGKGMSYLEVGRNQVVGRILGVTQLLLTFIIYLKIDGKEFSTPILLLTSIGLFVILIISGWIYMKLGLLEIEIQHRNRHSPEIMETLKILKEIKTEMERTKKE